MSALQADGAYLLGAGAILPKKTKVKDALLDVVEARSYAHPALPTPIVRLTPAEQAAGLDIAMSILGFGEPEWVEELGSVRREKLGFPGWALVHDQKNARHALDVLADLKRAVRRISRKPGAAKEAIDAIAKSLAGSVPHFLPSFYEEAARAFIEHDNYAYAQQYFEAARRAEREYALDVDETLREQSFVDFALAGALSVKSLSNFADELAERGKDGLEAYLRVCTRRSVGGLPPSPAMLDDLKRLAKSAGEDVDAIHARFIDAIVDSPSLASAAGGFFKKTGKALARLVKDQPARRAALLDLFPKQVSTVDWLKILDSLGALDALADPGAPGQSSLTVGKWITRASDVGGGGSALAELLERCAERVRAEGEVFLPKSRWYGLDVALTETALRIGLRVTRRHDDWDMSFELDDETKIDVPCIAADPAMRALFVDACAGLWSYDAAVEGLAERPAFAELLGEGIAKKLQSFGEGALPALAQSLELFQGLPEALWARYPILRESFDAVDVAAALAKTYEIGVLAELVWPAAAALATSKKLDVQGLFHSGDHVVLYDAKRVVVLDGDDQVVLDHKAQLAKGEEVSRAYWVDGDLCVCIQQGYESVGHYWASAPKVRAKHVQSWSAATRGYPLEGGGIFFEGTRLRKGDSPRETNESYLYDGERFYVWYDGKLHEYDLETGKRGEERAPAFLTVDGKQRWGRIDVCDAPPGAPVRSKGGLVGLRLTPVHPPQSGKEGEPGEEDVTVQRVDDLATGAAGTVESGADAVVFFPGSDVPRVLEDSYGGHEVFCQGIQGSSSDDAFHRFHAALPSMALLARYRTRDEATSKRLRGADADAVRAILEVASSEKIVEKYDEYDYKPAKVVRDAVAEWLPELTDDKLASVLVGIAHHAGTLEAQRRSVAEELPEAGAAALHTARSPGDPLLPDALGSFAWPMGHEGDNTILSEVAELRRRFDEPGEDGYHKEIAWGGHIWQLGLGHGAAFLHRYACAPAKRDGERSAIEAYLRAHVASGFEGEGAERVRIAFGKENRRKLCKGSYQPTWAVVGGNAVLTWQLGWDEDAHYSFIEHAPDGSFQVVTDAKDDRSGPGVVSDALIDEVVAHVAKHGPLPLEEALPAICEATGLSPAEAMLFATAHWEGDGFGRVKKGRESAARFWQNDPFMQPYPTHMLRQLEMATTVWTAGDFHELWDPAILAERVTKAFFTTHSKPLPPLTEADDLAFDTLPDRSDDVSLLARATSKDIRPVGIFQDRERFFDPEGYQEKGEGFSDAEEYVKTFCHALWLAPLSSGIVRSLPVLWTALRERYQAPSFFHQVYTEHYLWDDSPEEEARAVETLLAAFGEDIPKSLWRGKRKKQDIGALQHQPSGDERMIAHLTHGDLTLYAHARALLDDDVRLAGGEADAVAGLKREARFLLGEPGDAYIACAERLAGQEGYAGDPRVSAPKVVAKTAKILGVDEDAAALYLMLAALPKPTDRLVRTLSGMSKKQHETAGAALVKAELVIEAKRAGAGRSLFLPGAWVGGVEEWKKDTVEDGPWDVVPLPPDQLYARVLARLESGDRPRFEDPPKRGAVKKGKKK